MTNIEKAKAYDEIVVKAKELKEANPSDEGIQRWVVDCFPELKESEGERIRESLLEYLHTLPNHYAHSGVCVPEWVAWLEKQGDITKLSEEEQNRFAKGVLTSCAMSFIDYLDAHKHEGKMCVSNGECEDIENAFHNAMWDRLHRYYCKYIGKQGEQKPQGKSALEAIKEEKVDNRNCIKPVDKVEPKFKKGEWIIHQGTENIYQVTAIVDNQYQLKYGDNYTVQKCTDVDRCARLWDIAKDAKDGDVLSFNDGHGNDSIELIKSIIDKKIEFWFCLTNSNRYEVFDRITLYTNLVSREGATPATKEQRDTLMKAMNEAGYEWDVDKKELKKIEQKPVEEVNGEDYGIDSLWHAVKILEKTLGEVEGYQSDDGILEHKAAITAVKKLYKQKPIKWSEEDESRLNHIIQFLEDRDRWKSTDRAFPIEEDVKWLKSLKERLEELADKLQNLRPQSHWKPSEEQMIAIQEAMNIVGILTITGSKINSLYQDLKKLKK